MSIEIKVPSVGESVKEAVLAEWFKKDGDAVKKDEPIFVIETDKVTLEVTAEADGVLKILVPAGKTVAIGSVVGSLEPGKAAAEKPALKKEAAPPKVPEPPQVEDAPEKIETKPSSPARAPEVPSVQQAPTAPASAPSGAILSPSVRQLVAQKRVDISQVTGTGPGGRVTKGDILLYLEQSELMADASAPSVEAVCKEETADESKLTTRVAMSPIRKRIAERLLQAKQNTAMLTTFNEIDMSRAMEIRGAYKDDFQKKYAISLGFMSFFSAATVRAVLEVPELNAYIDGDDLVYHDYVHLGIAIGSGKGLVVPVIRHAEKMGFSQIEKAIVDYVKKIQDNRLSLSDMEGGTFTISNGGVYGSLLSTPILNSPQSGILGMHKIEKRPVVVDDAIVIRPMMYVALSYDHRVVDGKGAVTCLRRIKEYVENPERLLLEV
jgi:2-oxoglutarate dehydrogenase E2 component (dihydrolipoamide succinyltransferase)